MFYCGASVTLTDTLLLSRANDNGNGVDIVGISIDADEFQIPNKADLIGTGIAQNESREIIIEFTGDQVGTYSGTLELVVDLGDCFDILHVPVNAGLVEPTTQVAGGAFGSVAKGSTGQTQVTVENTSLLPITLNMPTDVFPFALVDSEPELPMELAAGTSVTLTFEFTPDAEREYEEAVELPATGDCDFIIPVTLTGTGTAIPADPVEFCIDGTYAGLVGDSVNIIIRSSESMSLNVPTDLSFTVHFDPRRLQFLGTVPEQGIDILKNDPGRMQVRQNGVTQTEGEQLQFLFRMLGGSGEETFVTLTSVLAEQGELTVSACPDSAQVRIAHRCIVSGLSFGKYPNKLEAARPNPAHSVVEVTFQQLEDARAVLQVWDAEGREVLRPFEQELTGGRYVVRFAIDELPSGLYYYGIAAGSYREVRKLLISR